MTELPEIYGQRFADLPLRYNLNKEHFTQVTPLLVETKDGLTSLSDFDLDIEDVKLLEKHAEWGVFQMCCIDENPRLYYLWQFLGFKNGVFAAKTLEALNEIIKMHDLNITDLWHFCFTELDSELYNILYDKKCLVRCLQKGYVAAFKYILDKTDSDVIENTSLYLEVVCQLYSNYLDNNELITFFLTKIPHTYKLIEYNLEILQNRNKKSELEFRHCIKLIKLCKFILLHQPERSEYVIKVIHATETIVGNILNSEYYKLYVDLLQHVAYMSDLKPTLDAELSSDKLDYIYQNLIEKLFPVNKTDLLKLVCGCKNSTNYLSRLFTDFPDEICNLIKNQKDVSLWVQIHAINNSMIHVNKIFQEELLNERPNLNILIYCVKNHADINLVDREMSIGLGLNLYEILSKFL